MSKVQEAAVGRPRSRRYQSGVKRRLRKELIDASLSIFHTINMSPKLSGCSVDDAVHIAGRLIYYAEREIDGIEAVRGEVVDGKVDVPSEDERGAKEDQPVPQGEAPDGRRARKVRR